MATASGERSYGHMVIAWLVLLVCVAGALIYALAANPKVSRIGEHMFWCGLLVMLFALAGKVVRIG